MREICQLKFCSQCVTPNTRPGITFDERGYCNACQWAEEKIQIDWRKKLSDLKTKITQRLGCFSLPPEYDCVMTISGGKDSTFQAWFAKEVLGLKVLGVRIEPLMPHIAAEANVRNIAQSIGIDVVSIINDKKIFAKLSRECFLRYGNPYIPFYYNIFSQTARIAVEKKIPFLIIGEDGDAENGGNTSKEFSKLGGTNIHLRAGGGRKSFIPSNQWAQWGVDSRDLNPYLELETSNYELSKTERFFLSHYIPWKDNSNFFTSLNIVGGFSTSQTRTVGTYTFGAGIDDKLDEIYLWLLWPKFGFHRATKSASNDIREGKLSRRGGVELVRLYEGEFPWDIFDEFLSVFDLSEVDFWYIVSRFVGDVENLIRIAREDGKENQLVVPAWKRLGENRWVHIRTVHGEERFLELPLVRPKVGQ